MAITMCLNRSLDADTDTLMLVERLAVGVTLNSERRGRRRGCVPREARPGLDGELTCSLAS